MGSFGKWFENFSESYKFQIHLARLYSTELDGEEFEVTNVQNVSSKKGANTNSIVNKKETAQERSINLYRNILSIDRTNIEALSSLAQNYFYNGHPEVALKMYQQLLSQAIYTLEIMENKVQIFNNIGLCLFQIEKNGLAMPTLKEALKYCIDEEDQANIWY